jgi:hypothetical protein
LVWKKTRCGTGTDPVRNERREVVKRSLALALPDIMDGNSYWSSLTRRRVQGTRRAQGVRAKAQILEFLRYDVLSGHVVPLSILGIRVSLA